MWYSILQQKTLELSKWIIKLCKIKPVNYWHEVIIRQLVRSVTSIWANIQEGLGTYTKVDMNYKFSLSYKEARESRYRMVLLYESDFISFDLYQEHRNQCDEIISMLYSILKKQKSW